MNIPAPGNRWQALRDRIASSVIAGFSIVRGLPLFLSARPRTPLRVLCLMAFDTVHRLRRGQRLSMGKLKTLAALLDFGACANAAFDHKDFCPHEYRVTLQLLEEAGLRSSADEYLRRLGALERSRPAPGGDRRQFQRVVLYREAVVRLSLGMVASTASGNQFLDEGIRATDGDTDLNFLFRITMQCQIIDDVLDHARDLAAGLPGFLTASPSLGQALELTRVATRGYADARGLPRTGDVFPLRIALFLVSTGARLVVFLSRWRYRANLGQQFTERLQGPRLLAVDASSGSFPR